MASTLNVSLIIKAFDRATAPMRAVTRNFQVMRDAKVAADRQFAKAANIRNAAEGMKRFSDAAVNAMKAPINAFEDFQAAMSEVKAVSRGITDQEFAEMTERAKELGATTRYTATQAAQGMKYLAVAGFKTSETLEAIPNVLDMATAAGMDLGRTSDILSDLMSAFGKKTSEAGNVADVLTTTFTGSNTTLETLFETMKIAAPIATDLGVSMKDVATMTGIMGNAGLKGSMAATSLRAVFNNLISPTGKAAAVMDKLNFKLKKTEDGSLDLVGMMEDLRQKTKGLDKATRMAAIGEIFGVRGMTGVSNIIRGIETGKFAELAGYLNDVEGTTKKVASVMDDNAKGATTRLSSAFDGLMLAIGEKLEPTLTSLKETITGMVQAMTGWVQRNPRLTRTLAIVAGTVTVLAATLTALMFTMAAFVTASGVMKLGLGGLKTASLLLRSGLWKAMLSVGRFTVSLITKGIPAVARFAATMIAKAVPALLRTAASALSAALPFLAIAAAIGAVTLAVIQLVKHWKELDFLEGLKGIAESIGDSGILSTIGELLDPRTLLKDMGIMGGTPSVGAPGAPTAAAPGAPTLATVARAAIGEQAQKGAVAKERPFLGRESGPAAVKIGSGHLQIKIDSDKPARVVGAKPMEGLGFDVDTGSAMAVSG